MSEVFNNLALEAKKASFELAYAKTVQKNDALAAIADALWTERAQIVEANRLDIDAGRSDGLNEGFIDRLTLDYKRIEGICEGVRQIALLADPVGMSDGGWVRPNGLRIQKRRVPLGVIGIIFEARPNVTVDAAALCLKSGNAVILRGGKEAIRSNMMLVRIMRDAIAHTKLSPNILSLVEDTTRESAKDMMEARGLIDVLIPRGGKSLIKAVCEGARVPVIETGSGVCHTFVDTGADMDMAENIVYNAKCSRVSVCNAMEQLIVTAAEAEVFLPGLYERLREKNVELRCCKRSFDILNSAGCTENVVLALDEDFKTEFNAYIMGVRVAESITEAIDIINSNGTGHSECIVTESLANANLFLDRVDAAAVYVNASTRFTDGFEFGFGGEIGISTQKLHARGPMGLSELTTIKYVVMGDGQIR